ncbi:MAG: MBL fold metallo-hydrolase [Pseudomonadota bacterium]|nr:MBL fold metallo-hydrolase [Pseudomonadota bacterium]
MNVTVMQLGPLETNCYIVHSEARALVIDPGGEAGKILAFLDRSGLSLDVILNTHLHFDHIQGNAALVSATGATVRAGAADAYLLDTELGGGGMMGLPRTPPFSYEPLTEGETEFLGASCRVMSTPGHSPGSLSFYFPDLNAVFVGDLLFYRSVGRTDFSGGSQAELARSVRSKIFSLPADTVVYPGHGPETTVGSEQLNNPFFTEFVR